MSRMGIAVIGASMRSQMIFRYLQLFPDLGYPTGIYDPIRQRGEIYLDHYGVKDATVYAGLEEAVSDPKVQAVFVGTPDGQHTEPVVKALQAGKHVYCEKPMAITMKDCDAIMAAAQKATSVLYVGMNLRHGPIHETLHQLLQSGRLGKLLTIEANEYYYGGRTYFRRWNRFRKFGGGLWITKACHDFDLLNWMAAARPTRVFATCSLSYYKPIPGAGKNCRNCSIWTTCPDYVDIEKMDDLLGQKLLLASEAATGQPQDLCLYTSEKDTFDNGIAVVEYENDIRATYTVNVVSARSTRQMRLMGTDGSAEGDMTAGIVTYWKRHAHETEVLDLRDRINSGHGGADDNILKDFFHCCQTGEKPRSSWADGRLSLLVGLAATESSDTGQVVPLNV